MGMPLPMRCEFAEPYESALLALSRYTPFTLSVTSSKFPLLLLDANGNQY